MNMVPLKVVHRRNRPPTFSPGEKRVRQAMASRRWQKRNPEKVKAQARRRWLLTKDHQMAKTKAWYAKHPGMKAKVCRRATREMRPYYLRALLRYRGITNPTEKDFEDQRERVRRHRIKNAVLRFHPAASMLAACSTSSPIAR